MRVVRRNLNIQEFSIPALTRVMTAYFCTVYFGALYIIDDFRDFRTAEYINFNLKRI